LIYAFAHDRSCIDDRLHAIYLPALFIGFVDFLCLEKAWLAFQSNDLKSINADYRRHRKNEFAKTS